jgi:hypothetical protein
VQTYAFSSYANEIGCFRGHSCIYWHCWLKFVVLNIDTSASLAAFGSFFLLCIFNKTLFFNFPVLGDLHEHGQMWFFRIWPYGPIKVGCWTKVLHPICFMPSTL